MKASLLIALMAGSILFIQAGGAADRPTGLSTPEQIKAWQALDAAELAYKSETTQLSETIARLNGKILASTANVDKMRAEYRQARSDVPFFGGWGSDSTETRRIAELKAKREAAESALDGAKTQLEKDADDLRAAQNQFRQRQREFDRVAAGYNETIEGQKRIVERLESEIRGADAFQKYSELRSDITDAQVKLAVLENVADQSLMGVYVEQKLTKLMNSSVLCEAAKSCAQSSANPARATVDKSKVKAELFATPGAQAGGASGSTSGNSPVGTQ